MKFCSDCGNPVGLRIPDGDSRERHVCAHCGMIHYQNPRIIAGTLPFVGEQVLLCRRAIEPRLGFWTLPAGFMENGETTAEAAARETLEEADAKVLTPDLYAIFNLPHINQVYIFFRAALADGHFGAGPESLESRLFSEHEIPWGELAFPTVKRALTFYFEDRKTGCFPIRVEDIRRPPTDRRAS
jgi:ADP-ribose pyrophosphatase YjhB (NUDIX family)